MKNKDILTISQEIFTIDQFLKVRRHYHVSGIYCWYNTVNQKIYIGSTNNLNKRFTNYRLAIEQRGKCQIHNEILSRAFKKYPKEAFLFIIIEKNIPVETLVEKEQKYLDTWKPFREKGYNISPSAESSRGTKRTPEQVKAMSVRQQGELSHAAKITNNDVLKAFELFANGKTMKEISKIIGISYRQIQTILNRKSWVNVEISEELMNRVKDNYMKFITNETAIIIGERLLNGERSSSIAKSLKISNGTVDMINNGLVHKFVKEKLAPNRSHILFPSNQTPKDVEVIIEEHLKNGISNTEISKQTGVCTSTIIRIKRKIGIKIQEQHVIDETTAENIALDILSGTPFGEIAKKFCVCKVTVSEINRGITHAYLLEKYNPGNKYIKNPRNYLPPDKEHLLIEMLKANKRSRDIKKELGLSNSCIQVHKRLLSNNPASQSNDISQSPHFSI